MSTGYFIVVVVLSLGLTIVTLPNLWRPSHTPWERLVYRYGVRGVGLGGGILFSIVFPYQLGGDVSLSKLAVRSVVYLLIGLPLWLWAGYWWGRTMAASFNVSRTNAKSGGS